uniref:Uncharacterized protein n=1 Tax=Kalanchoe fedtschenkoi TaxID=63787 RepID=A0A7N0TS34_KALFE
MDRIEEELRIEFCSVMGRTIGESEEERRYQDRVVVHAAPPLRVAKYLNEFAHLLGEELEDLVGDGSADWREMKEEWGSGFVDESKHMRDI